MGNLLTRILAIKIARRSVLHVTLNTGKTSKLKFCFGLFRERNKRQGGKEEEGKKRKEEEEEGGRVGRRSL